MKRRSSSRNPAKTRHTTKPKRSSAAKAGRRPSSSAADLQNQNERQARELAEAREQQAATSNILRIISQSPTDARPVFDGIVVTAARLLRSDHVAVMLRDGDTFSAVAAATPEGLVADARLGKNVRIDPSTNFPSRAIIDGKMLHLPDWSLIDLPTFELERQREFGIKSALYLPLLHDGMCIGLLTLVAKRPHSFGPAEIAQAESFRDQALIAIENARLLNELRQRTDDLTESLEQQTATSEVLGYEAANGAMTGIGARSAASPPRQSSRADRRAGSLVESKQIAAALTPASYLSDNILSFPVSMGSIPT